MESDTKKRGSLHSSMGRPIVGSMGSFPESLRKAISDLRDKEKGWGADTILSELQLDKRWIDTKLPSRSSLASFLKQEGFTKVYEPHSPVPVPVCQKAKRSHSLWQVDGQGNVNVSGVGAIAMLNIKDVYSSVYVCNLPTRMKSMTSHPNTCDYQTAMRFGFIQHGLPHMLQSDHASVFYENSSKSPFPTRFCLWLIGLGIQPCFSRVHRPTDQGKVERAHQTFSRQVLSRKGGFKNWEDLLYVCQQRRQRLNEHIPSSATDNVPPLKKYPKARHSGRFYHPEQEAQMINMQRIYAFLAKGKWFRKVARNKTVSLGSKVYYIPGAKYQQQLVITFNNHKKLLIFQNDKEQIIYQAPVKDLYPELLMGNLEQFERLPALQLELPFDWNAQKINTTFSDFT